MLGWVNFASCNKWNHNKEEEEGEFFFLQTWLASSFTLLFIKDASQGTWCCVNLCKWWCERERESQKQQQNIQVQQEKGTQN